MVSEFSLGGGGNEPNINRPSLGSQDATALGQQRIRIDPVAVFITRAEAPATLHAARELSPHDAVDTLQEWAERDGLVPAIGQDAVQELLATAFVHQRDDLPRDADVSEPIADEADDEYDGLS